MFLAEKEGALQTVSCNSPGDDVVGGMVAHWAPDRIVKLTTNAQFEVARDALGAGGSLVLAASPSTEVTVKDDQGATVATYAGEQVYP